MHRCQGERCACGNRSYRCLHLTPVMFQAGDGEVKQGISAWNVAVKKRESGDEASLGRNIDAKKVLGLLQRPQKTT